VKVKLTCIAEVTCETGNKRKVYKKGHKSENLSVLGVELKAEILATMCYQCV
jgi:hypothetical protein